MPKVLEVSPIPICKNPRPLHDFIAYTYFT